MTSVEN